jgi:conjugal transfer pilus assembly protein TraD
MSIVERLLWALMLGASALTGSGILLAWGLRRRGFRWTWALLGLPVSLLLLSRVNGLLGPAGFIACALACVLGAKWHRADIAAGADHAEIAHARIGIVEVLRDALDRHWRAGGRGNGSVNEDRNGHSWMRGEWLEVGRDGRGRAASIPVGFESGSHTLIVGATGAGKTVSEAWIACRLIEAGHGAVVVDPKGDAMLHEQLRASAERRGVPFLEWSPEGSLAYNPYAHGSHTEIADKALAGERFTEPHYLRQAQRYIANAVRAMQAAKIPVTPRSLALHMQPIELEETARKLDEELAEEIHDYLDGLGERGRRELSGVRDRLAIIAESDARDALVPRDGHPVLDLHRAIRERAVVYFRLDADRRLLLSSQIARAVIIDLVGLVAELQRAPIPTVVLIDEFSAIAADQVARLFGRSRSAGVSLILATQELADLKTSGGDRTLRDQVLGNIQALLAHRQNVPESAELLSQVAGTKPVWITTQRTNDGLLGSGPSGQGTRRRAHEYEIHPSLITRLPTGHALLVTPGQTQAPAVVRVHQPSDACR